MIQKFVDRFMAAKPAIRAEFAKKHVEDYKSLVTTVIKHVAEMDDYNESEPDPERIHQIDDGDYQGTLVFVIGAQGYQPSDYWFVKVGYGSCSGCDTLEDLRGYSGEKPDDDQIDGYMSLALHVVQGLKEMGGETA